MGDKAVICGINNYKSISDLQGCINDVENVRKLLTEEFDFESDNVQTYADDEVTKKTIVDAFKWLAEGAKDSDRLVFHFSGHGSYTKSKDKDEELDELICLYDMDWENPDSYIIDDDLGKLTRLVKAGRLTVILDNCNSGSGTRALTKNFSLARSVSPKSRLFIVADTAAQIASSRSADTMRRLEQGNSALMRSFREEREHLTFARFVEPPSEFRRETDTQSVKRLGFSMRAALNHQLLAGARDDQTAADAFINNAYNGAFSFHLCDTVRSIGAKSYDEVMAETINRVKAAGYSQIPQNEGQFGNERIFGGANVGNTPEADNEAFTGPHDSSKEDLVGVESQSKNSPGTDEVAPLKVLSDLLRVSEKLIDLSARTERSTAISAVNVRASGDEVVVYVHGISKHSTGYSVPWFNAMRPHLARSVQRHEVLWSPIVNSRTASLENIQNTDMLREIEHELENRRAALFDNLSSEVGQESVELSRGSGFSTDDFSRYMLVTETRNAILAEFDRIVRPLLAAGKKVHIVAHSWGTVVAYEGLRRLDSAPLPGRVANLFFAGSALSISVVRSNLFARVGNGRKPSLVDKVINVDAGGDLLGGPIGEQFTVHREFLGVDPVECSKIIFTDIALNPACAHSSYFRAANTGVNRDIFAHFINKS